jgi:SAM-dependent methyltransferase
VTEPANRPTTSIHRLNADRRLPFGPAGKLAWLVLNRVNNVRPYASLDARLQIHDFQCDDVGARAATFPAAISPSRMLSDLFWMSLPWSGIASEVGGPIRVFDIGCGNGEYGQRLLAWSGGRIGEYAGTDVQVPTSWPDDPRMSFVRAEASTLTAFPAAANLIMSQSTIEHIDDDLRFFQHVRDHVQARAQPTLQVHLCPSAACLSTYLWHGVRQYTPRTPSRTTTLFDDCALWLFRLGGRACNRLHFHFVTGPHFLWRTGDRRLKEPAEYQVRLRRAVSEDMSEPQPSPAFYALVIHTHPRSQLF